MTNDVVATVPQTRDQLISHIPFAPGYVDVLVPSAVAAAVDAAAAAGDDDIAAVACE